MTQKIPLRDVDAIVNSQPYTKWFRLVCQEQKMTPAEFLREHYSGSSEQPERLNTFSDLPDKDKKVVRAVRGRYIAVWRTRKLEYLGDYEAEGHDFKEEIIAYCQTFHVWSKGWNTTLGLDYVLTRLLDIADLKLRKRLT